MLAVLHWWIGISIDRRRRIIVQHLVALYGVKLFLYIIADKTLTKKQN